MVAGLILLAILGIRLLQASFDPDAFKPRIEAAVYRATGRTLAIGGKLRIGLFNGPRIKATDVTLSNLPGGSRPQMLRVAEVKARLVLLPLLAGRIEIDRLELIRPDILLEIDAAGQPNWRFATPTRATDSRPDVPVSGAAVMASPQPSRLVVRNLEITGGAAELLDARSGRRIAVDLTSLSASAPADDDPLTFALTATAGGIDLKLTGQTGPLARLTAPAGNPAGDAAASGKAWPVRLELTTLGARATLTGTLDPAALAAEHADPQHPGRYDLALAATVQNMATLAPALPGVTLPAVKDLHLKLTLAGVRGEPPELRQLDLSAGHSELNAVVPGLVVDQVSIVDPSAEAPLQAKAAGSYGGAAFTIAADLGAPAALRASGPERAPFPISFSATAAGAHLTAKGGILHPRTLHGLDLTVDARVPDLGAFAPLLRRPLPALQDLTGHAKVTDGVDGILDGLTLTGLHVTTPGTDATADLAVAWAPRAAVAGHISAASVDAGGLTSAFASPINPPPPTLAAAPAVVPAGAPTAAAAATNGPQFLISDRPIRFDRGLTTDADLQVAAKTVTWPDEVWHNLTGHLMAGGGKLRLESVAADLPAGHSEAALDVDASQPMPAVALALRSPGVSLWPVLALLGLPEAAGGRLEVDANLHGIGHSPHEIAATADGSLGLAMVGGSVEGGAAQQWVTELLRRAALPDGARLSGRAEIDCFALRLDLSHGLGVLRALALQTPLLSLTGSGAMNLAEETVAMRVRAVASVGIGIAVPFDVSGPLRAPRVKANIAGGATSALEGAAGLVIGRLGGAGGDAGGLGGPTCAAELPTARGGWTGKLPAAVAARPATAPAPAPTHSAERAPRVFRWLLP